MNIDPNSVAALVRTLPDADIIRLVHTPGDAALAALIRLLPDADLVRLVDIARDSDRPADAPAASSAPARPANRSSRRTAAAPDADVVIMVRLIEGTVSKGQASRKVLLEASSGADWIANGWGPERVKAALATALDSGAVAMEGKNRGAHYVLTDKGRELCEVDVAPPDADVDAAPGEVST